jgi:cation transport protein ChaC
VARGGDVWIFGYGSLMWDPGFAFVEAQPALLRGYHRSFCVYSHRYRGTPERPGLVLGLDRGGACKGIAYRVPAADVASALHYLWEREMANRTNHLKEVPLATPAGPVMARAFAVDRTHKNYAGRLPLEATARLILQGIGARGPCRQYLENTVRPAALRRRRILDPTSANRSRKSRRRRRAPRNPRPRAPRAARPKPPQAALRCFLASCYDLQLMRRSTTAPNCRAEKQKSD